MARKKYVPVGNASNGKKIYISEDKFESIPEGMMICLREAISSHDVWKANIYEHKFPYVIGKTACVSVNKKDKDHVVWVVKEHGNKIPVVYGKSPEKTFSLTFVVRYDKKANVFFIVDCYYGEKCPPSPADRCFSNGLHKVGKKIAKEFWGTHALVRSETVIDVNLTKKFSSPEDWEKFVNLEDYSIH